MPDNLINTAQRRESIVNQVIKEGSVSVNQLSKEFNVSTVTIRNDLRYLEHKGCLLRSYGGGILNKQFVFDRPLHDKNKINFSIKNVIAQQAAALVEDGDRIILDSGSTTTLMVPYLQKKRDLIVMTNALNIAYDLITQTNIDVLIAGGNIRREAYSISGPSIEQLLKMYHFNKLFLGVDGFDLDAGITTPNFAEAHVNRTMCEVSQQIIAVTDSSKFGRKSFCMIEKIENIHTVVTDSKIPAHYRNELTAKGVNVIFAN